MRIAVLDTYYPAFLAEHYATRPALRHEPYDTQLRALLRRCFGTFDAYTHHLNELGHDARNVILNAQPLQARWSAEHHLPGRTRLRLPLTRLPPVGALQGRLLREIALAQIADHDAEVVYVHGLASLTRGDLDALRAQGRIVAGQIASPLPEQAIVEGYDLILSSFPHFVERFRALGIASESFALGFDGRVLESVGPTQRSYGAVFVGGLHPRWHGAGTALLEAVAAELPLDVWGYGVEGLPADSPLRARYHGQAWGLEMYRVLGSAKVVVNRHIATAEGVANNMRLYEASGMGACVLTESAPNLGDVLEPGVECETYEGPEDLVAKLRALLGDDARREAIAAAGRARTLRDHSYRRRMTELADVLGRTLQSRRRA